QSEPEEARDAASRVDDVSRGFSGLQRGTTWETPDPGGFQASWKPVLWLEAFPTASGIPGIRSAAVFTNLAELETPHSRRYYLTLKRSMFQDSGCKVTLAV
ncbi:hypothetical protein, partial [Levilactobacillus fujinensis]